MKVENNVATVGISDYAQVFLFSSLFSFFLSFLFFSFSFLFCLKMSQLLIFTVIKGSSENKKEGKKEEVRERNLVIILCGLVYERE